MPGHSEGVEQGGKSKSGKVICNNCKDCMRRKKFQCTLTMVNIQKSPATVPKIIPKVWVLNARSLAKPDALPALYAELTSKNIDICVV